MKRLQSTCVVWCVPLAMLLGACGSTRSAEPTRRRANPPHDEAQETLSAIGSAVGDGGSVSSTSLPSGGAVLVGASTIEDGGRRTSNLGVVVDAHGTPTRRFALPTPLLERGIVASDDSLVITGVPCTNAAAEDESSGTWTCEPGGIVAFRVDLASGSSTELELPEAVAKAGTTMSGLPMGLFRSGTEVVLIAATSADPTLEAWRLDRSDRWVVAEAPMIMPCQVGNEIVEPSGPRPDRSEGHGMVVSTPSARVFDPHASRWGPGVTGLALSSASDAPPTTVCTRTRLVEVPHGGSGAPTAASFDPKEHAWRSLTLPKGKGVPAPIAHPGLDHVVVFRIGADPAGPAISLDPATGATEEIPLHLDSTATLVALSPSSALVIDRDGTIQVTSL